MILMLGTASIALEYVASEDEPIAILVHDAIEDRGGPTTGEDIHHSYYRRLYRQRHDIKSALTGYPHSHRFCLS